MLKNDYNKIYYNKNREKIKTDMKNRYVGEEAERIKSRQKFLYYRKMGRLSVLKEKYPIIYHNYVM
tara:strand:+ start:556 stop:753 length:198 start_codon:yes stop_codon:yes gene_type:complete